MGNKCKDCKYFDIIDEPVMSGGLLWEVGVAVCSKHNRAIDFMDDTNIDSLECLEKRGNNGGVNQ